MRARGWLLCELIEGAVSFIRGCMVLILVLDQNLWGVPRVRARGCHTRKGMTFFFFIFFFFRRDKIGDERGKERGDFFFSFLFLKL